MEEIVTTVAEYSVTTAALAKLKTELSGKKYAVDNATGMALAKFDRRGLVSLRTDLEKKRIEIKAPALERCKLIDSEANRIKAELFPVRTA
jgi:colicin import membrane protein